MIYLFVFVLTVTAAQVKGQDDDFGVDDVGDIKIQKQGSKVSGKGRWRRNISGSVGHSSVVGTVSEYRGYSHARLRFSDIFFNHTKVVLEGLSEYIQIQILQTPQKGGDAEGKGDKKLKYTKGTLRWEEAYIEQDFFDRFSLSYGIQKIVWGQFEPFSPTNFTFPFNLSTADIDFTKAKGTLSQEAGIFRFHIMDNMDLSLYAFPKLTYDSILQGQIDSPGDYDDGNGEYSEDNKTLVDLPSGKEKLQTGIRLMYYPSWGTAGLSYYKGFNTSGLHRAGKIKEDNSGSLYKTETLTFGKQEMYGVEFSIPAGNWVYKLEYSMSTTEQDIGLFSNDLNNDDGELTPEQDKFLQALINDNGGDLSIFRTIDMVAIGATGDLRRWFFNLIIFYFDIRYDKATQRLVDLKEKAEKENYDSGYTGPFFPGFIISRYLDDDKSGQIGMAAGVISNGQGVALFYKKTTDSMVYGLGLQSLDYFADDAIIETNKEEGYERKSQVVTGVLASLTYKF